jgi:hypothetical protein
MRPPFCYVVKPVGGRRYDNIKKIGDVDFIMSSSEEDHHHSNRYAEVVETPVVQNTSIEVSKGDVLLVHHNVFKFYNGMKGDRKSGRSFFRNDTFLLFDEQFFMVKKNGVWNCLEGFSFIRMPEVRCVDLKSVINNTGLIGEIVYHGPDGGKLGLSVGDKVSFVPETESRFNVDGEVLFRIRNSHITMKINEDNK